MRKYIIIVPCAKKSNCQKAVSQAELPISGVIWPISYIISHKLELMTLYPFDCGQIFGLSVSVFRISLWLLRDVLASAKLQCGNLFRKSGFVSEYRSPSAGDPRYGRWGNSKVSKQRERESIDTFQNLAVWSEWCSTDCPQHLLCFYVCHWDSFIQSCEILFLSGNRLFTEFCCLRTFAMLIEWYELFILGTK